MPANAVFTGFELTPKSWTEISLSSILAADPKKDLNRTGYAHIAFSLGNKEAVDSLTVRLKNDGYAIVSGPRATGDGYYESCIVAIEDNQIEITI